MKQAIKLAAKSTRPAMAKAKTNRCMNSKLTHPTWPQNRRV
jgi:hypothetical protein